MKSKIFLLTLLIFPGLAINCVADSSNIPLEPEAFDAAIDEDVVSSSSQDSSLKDSSEESNQVSSSLDAATEGSD